MMHPQRRRQIAVDATIARFANKPFAWGTRDCVRVSSWHVRQLGYRVSILKGRRYSNALTARRTLKDLGFDTLEAAVDSLGFPRIPPAMAMIGDLVAIPSDDATWPALCVAVGNGDVLTAKEGRWGVGTPNAFVTAWKVF
jgi:hypothetical protein